MLSKNVSTFIACDSEYNEAGIVLFGVGFDSTTSFRPGARFGPSAIRNESFGIETYKTPGRQIGVKSVAHHRYGVTVPCENRKLRYHRLCLCLLIFPSMGHEHRRRSDGPIEHLHKPFLRTDIQVSQISEEHTSELQSR